MADPNLRLLKEAARLLIPVLDELVFVGGCMTGLLIGGLVRFSAFINQAR